MWYAMVYGLWHTVWYGKVHGRVWNGSGNIPRNYIYVFVKATWRVRAEGPPPGSTKNSFYEVNAPQKTS